MEERSLCVTSRSQQGHVLAHAYQEPKGILSNPEPPRVLRGKCYDGQHSTWSNHRPEDAHREGFRGTAILRPFRMTGALDLAVTNRTS